MASCLPSGASTVSRTTSSGCSSLFCQETLCQSIFDSNDNLMDLDFKPSQRVDGIQTFRQSQTRQMQSLNACSVIRDDLIKQESLRRPVAAAHLPFNDAADIAACRSASPSPIPSPAASPFPSSPPAAVALPAAYRVRMVAWMREVSEALGLHMSTLFAATSLLDRFVAASKTLPPESLLQLLTLTCMSVAVKYNETGQIAPAVWLSLAINEEGKPLYRALDLQRCEFSLLQILDWRLHQPNTYTFLEQFLMCLRGETSAAAPSPSASAAASFLTAASGSTGGDAMDTDCCAPGAFAWTTYGAAAAAAAAAAGAQVLGPDVPRCVPVLAAGAQGTAVPAAAAAAAAASGPVEPPPHQPQQQQQQRQADAWWWWPFLNMSVTLAEATLLNETFLSYDYSAVALACISLAEQMTLGFGGCKGGGGDADDGGCGGPSWTSPTTAAFETAPATPPSRMQPYCINSYSSSSSSNSSSNRTAAGTAALAVSAAAGLSLPVLAPGLESCRRDLERCYSSQLMVAQQHIQRQMQRQQQQPLERYYRHDHNYFHYHQQPWQHQHQQLHPQWAPALCH